MQITHNYTTQHYSDMQPLFSEISTF